jgi:hypothetical protein
LQKRYWAVAFLALFRGQVARQRDVLTQVIVEAMIVHWDGGGPAGATKQPTMKQGYPIDSVGLAR